MWLTMGFSAPSAARTILATGGVYGGPEQKRAYCYVFNGGAKEIRLGDPEIIKQDGTQPDQHVIDTCSSRFGPPPWILPAGQTCLVGVKIDQGATYSCRVVIQGTKPNVRGNMDLRDEADQVLTSSPLR
jgi:hypothetical protein